MNNHGLKDSTSRVFGVLESIVIFENHLLEEHQDLFDRHTVSVRVFAFKLKPDSHKEVSIFDAGRKNVDSLVVPLSVYTAEVTIETVFDVSIILRVS